MHAMADWYVRGGECEQGRLSRILDVAQDLKALSMLLSGNSFPLVIDLACLASRREYLKLDKWLTDKIYEHKVFLPASCGRPSTTWLTGVSRLHPLHWSISGVFLRLILRVFVFMAVYFHIELAVTHRGGEGEESIVRRFKIGVQTAM